MPNHITTIIKASPKVLNFLTETGTVDFSKIIPQPERLHDVRVDGTEYIAEYLCNTGDEYGKISFIRILGKQKGFASMDDSDLDNLFKMIKNIRDYGHATWYGWSVKNWGTKWNAYEVTISNGAVTFETAWSHPEPVIEELSKKFPDDEIEIRYADEDIGYNLGHYTIKNGKVTKFDIEDNIKFATDVKGVDPEEWGYVVNPKTGKYEYAEE